MSQALAFANGWNLAITLMVCVVVFHADAGLRCVQFEIFPFCKQFSGRLAASGLAFFRWVGHLS